MSYVEINRNIRVVRYPYEQRISSQLSAFIMSSSSSSSPEIDYLKTLVSQVNTRVNKPHTCASQKVSHNFVFVH